MANMAGINSTGPLMDSKVDLISGITGVIDSVASLSFDVSDASIIKNLDQRIEDSRGYFDNPSGHNLTQYRNNSARMLLNKNSETTQLYRFQQPYQENQLYIAVESIVAYLTAQNPAPEVYPSQDTQQSRIFAQDLEKAMMSHTQEFQLAGLLESVIRNIITKKVGFLYLYFDPDHGENGEIIPCVINPEHVVIDKNAKKDENPAFISLNLKMSVNQICHRWPNKKKEIYEELGIQRGTAKQMEQEIVIREVWLTHYDKDYQPMEGVVYYFGNLVLDKCKNPNWIHSKASKNFLKTPVKPFIPLNFDNDGSHWIDYTSPLEQAIPLQMNLNKRGRQMMELADKANGLLVVSSDSGLTKDDLQNLTGDPNQRLIIKTMGQHTSDLIYQVPPPVVIPFLMQDKQDQRVQIHSIMGTPSEFSGANDGTGDGDSTLGQSMMKKNQASGRQDLFARAIDRFMSKYFNFWVQMATVWYTDKHWFVYNGGDGDFDYITISRDLIEDGIAVSVKSGGSLPFDKERQEAIGLHLAKLGMIAPLDLYKLLHIPNPQKTYDNLVKFKSAPDELARDALEENASNEAFMAYIEIMGGKTPKDPDDCTKEFVLTLRKLMLRDEFIKADRKKQAKFLEFVDKAIKSLDLRTSLDQLGQQGVDQLDPKVPIPPPMPPQLPPGLGTPGVPGMPPPMGEPLPPPAMGAPGLPPSPLGAMGGQSMMPAAAPMMPPALPPNTGGPVGATPGMIGGSNPGMGSSGVFNGVPVNNPARPTTPQPGNISHLPSF